MSRWRDCHPPAIGPNLKPEIILCHCLLDREAYAYSQGTGDFRHVLGDFLE